MGEPALSPAGALVRRGDPERFLAAMLAPEPVRERLFALYAFNLEVARIASVASEPMIGLIRLQWWREAVEEAYAGAKPRAHEIVEPLCAAIREAQPPRALFDALFDARARDMEDAPFGDAASLDAYLHGTGGALLRLGAEMAAPGAGEAEAAREAGFAFAAASWLRAAPALEAAGRAPFAAEDGPEALAARGLAALIRARAARGDVPRAAAPAFAAGRAAETILRGDPRAPAGPSPFRDRALLFWTAFTGRW